DLGGALSAANVSRRVRYAIADIPAVSARRAALGVPGESLIARAGIVTGIALILGLGALGLFAWRRRCDGPPSAGDPALVLAAFAVLHYAVYAFWLWTPGEDVYRAYY